MCLGNSNYFDCNFLLNNSIDNATYIRDCYALGNVTGRNSIATQHIGGLIGDSYTQLDIKNVYAAGVVTAGTGVTTLARGGLIGYNQFVSGADIYAGFWNITLNPTLSDIGAATNAITNHAGISGVTTANMTSASPTIYTSAGWDFLVQWKVDTTNANGGYPMIVPSEDPIFIY